MDQPMPQEHAYGDATGASQGPQPVEDIGFNQDVQNVLWSRVQSLSAQEVELIDAIVTPQTFPVLCKLFPEMKMLFEQASAMDDAGGQGPVSGAQLEQNSLSNPNVSRGLMG